MFLEILQSGYAVTMKTTVMVTARGVITLPAKLRRALGLKADDILIAETTPEGLLLRPSVTLPVEIYSAELRGARHGRPQAFRSLVRQTVAGVAIHSPRSLAEALL